MKNIFAISIEPGINVNRLIECLKREGQTYKIHEDLYLYASETETPQKVYEKIAVEEYKDLPIVILKLSDENTHWGLFNKFLWQWLRDNYKNEDNMFIEEQS